MCLSEVVEVFEIEKQIQNFFIGIKQKFIKK